MGRRPLLAGLVVALASPLLISQALAETTSPGQSSPGGSRDQEREAMARDEGEMARMREAMEAMREDMARMTQMHEEMRTHCATMGQEMMGHMTSMHQDVNDGVAQLRADLTRLHPEP